MGINRDKEKLIERYTIDSIEEMKLPSRLSTVLISKRSTIGFRLLLHGTPGTGKTTTGKLMTIGHNVLYLSGSNEFNIDLMRKKVYPFCSGFSVDGKQKTLFIDEAENISDKIQDAFKIILDSCKTVNFIFCTNEIGKMNSAILSRCAQLEYNFYANEIQEQKVNYISYLKFVCDSEQIPYDKGGLAYLFKTKFPDFRALLESLQLLKDANQPLTEETIKLFTAGMGKTNKELYELIEDQSNYKEFFTKISAFRGKEKDCIASLAEPFFIYLNDKGKFEQTLKACVIVEKHSNNFSTSLNKFNTFFALCTELKSIFK